MSKVWFITGSASGLGRNIAEAVSRIGRSPRRNSPRSRSLGRSRKFVQENSDYSAGGEADTSGAFDLVVSKMRKGTEPPPHVHSREHAAAEIWKTARSDGRGEAFE